MNVKKPLVIVVGPTAIGKSSLSIELAKSLNGEIISADSMQIYKYMDIGTAKIREDEKQGIKHYLVDEVCPDVDFSVSDFQGKSNLYIDEILKKDKLPIVVGGTGLYINSLIYELDFANSISNWDLRNKYMAKANELGNECIHKELEEIDPISAKRIHLNDIKRIIRAIEIFHETGKPMSEYYKDFRKARDEFKIVMIGLKMDREKLYERINQRVDIMMDEGLVNEVEKLLTMGYYKNLTSMQAIGYKEIIKHFDGEYSMEETIEILKRESRRYAKRQMTWFRKEERVHWVDVDDFNDISSMSEYVSNYICSKLKG